MRREEFLTANHGAWDRLEQLLLATERRNRRQVARLGLSDLGPDPTEFDALYRVVCRHLALARQRDYGDDVTARLNDLALRAYRELYGARVWLGANLVRLLLTEIPSTIRSRWAVVATSAAALVLPLAAMTLAVLADPSLVRSVYSAEEIRMYEWMYDPSSSHYARERPSEGDLAMFGGYVYTNIGIAFRTFAWGLPGGVGALFILVSNGLMIGALTGHLIQTGYGDTFLPFIAGHSAFELSAIVLAGSAGLELGWSWLAPGRRTRGESLRLAGRPAVALVGGAFVLLLLAAFVEAYWSSKTFVPAGWKYAVAACCWALVLVWVLRIPRHGP